MTANPTHAELVERLKKVARTFEGATTMHVNFSPSAQQTVARNYAEAASAIEALEAENARLREAVESMFCPRPADRRPDKFDVKDCVAAGECGCSAAILARTALNPERAEKMKRTEYRLIPGWYLRFQLQRRCWLMFWVTVAVSDDATELLERVAYCDGFIRSADHGRAALQAARPDK